MSNYILVGDNMFIKGGFKTCFTAYKKKNDSYNNQKLSH